MAGPKKKGLGRGLGALITTSMEDISEQQQETPTGKPLRDGSHLLHLDPTELSPNPHQPRATFNEEALQELSESIRRDGVIEPIIVRKKGDGYELVSGERRVRASIMADVRDIPAICRNYSDEEVLKLGLIENIQREDLNPIELANGYEQLLSAFHWTQEELAREVGKKRATITNTLRLLHLHPIVQQHVIEGAITMGHARAILAFDIPEQQVAACRKIVAQGLSVRQAEKLATPKQRNGASKTKTPDPHVAQIESDLRHRFGTKVHVHHGTDHKGRIEIEYYNLDDMDRILLLLKGSS